MFSKKFEKPAFYSNSTEKLILNLIKIPLKTYTKEHTFDMIAEWPATLVLTGFSCSFLKAAKMIHFAERL